MDRNRAYHIRLEIDRLKRELAEIEQENLSPDERTDSATAMTCGHDIIIENLRSTARRLGQNGRAVLAGWQENRGGSNPWWYSTTVTPDVLPYYIRSVANLVRVLELFSKNNVLELVKVLFENENGLHEAELSNALNLTQDEFHRMTSTLIGQGYISESSQQYVLTFKGWQFFIVVSHLIWFQNLKLEPSKALKIVPAFQEVFEIQWGEFLGKDEDTALKELRDKGWLKRLTDEGVIEEDIRKAIYEHNYIPEE